MKLKELLLMVKWGEFPPLKRGTLSLPCHWQPGKLPMGDGGWVDERVKEFIINTNLKL